MNFNEIHLDKDREEKFEYIDLRPNSDFHLGDKYCNTELIQEEVDWVKAKDNRFTGFNGDIFNCATIHSVSDSYESKMTPHEELKYGRKFFGDIADSVLWINKGNHEDRIRKADSIDLAEELAISLDTLYMKEGGVIKLKFGERKTNGKPQVYTIYATHGFTGSRTVGGKANRLNKLRNIVVTDIYIVSHSHQKISFNKSIYWPDMRNNKVTKKKQTFVNTGAYLDYGGYGMQKAYDPTELGTFTLRLYGKEKNIDVIM